MDDWCVIGVKYSGKRVLLHEGISRALALEVSRIGNQLAAYQQVIAEPCDVSRARC